MDSKVEAAIPLVDATFAVLGFPLGPAGITAGLAKLRNQPTRPLYKFMVDAAEALDRSNREYVVLGDATRDKVQDLLIGRLVNGDRIWLLSGAVFGRDEFSRRLFTGVQDQVDALTPDEQNYLAALITQTHGHLLTFVKKPEIFADAATSAIRTLATALEAVAREVENRPTRDEFDSTLDELRSELSATVDALRAELARRPQQLVLGNRPRLATHFVDRDEWQRVVDALDADGVATLCALQGMRGVGKSQLASAFAQRCEEAGWDFVGWVTASTRDEAVTTLAGFARTAGVAPDDASPEEAATMLVNWLNDGKAGDRLLVFDNVESADDLNGLIPRGNGMRVIATTTGHSRSLGTAVEVGAYTPEQAVRYLLDATGLQDEHGAADVATDLDRLPVALTQAATLINRLHIGFARYRELLDDRDLDDAVRREDGDPYPDKVGRALRLAYRGFLDTTETANPTLATVARRILGAVSLLNESGTPRDWLSALADDPLDAAEAVGALIDQSLLTPDAEGDTIALHRLLARVIREDATDADTMHAVVDDAEAVLTSQQLPDVGDFHDRRDRVRQVSAALLALLDQTHSAALLERVRILALCTKVTHRTHTLGDPYTGIRLGAFVPVRERVLGAEHPDTLTSRNNLASAYEAAGDLGRAIPLYQQTLTDSERVLGPKYPNTLTTRNNLANAYRSAGDLGRAIPLYEQTLTDSERVLGGEHSDTLRFRNNLANAYRSAGDLGRAIPLFQQTLTDSERVLGGEHPDTLRFRNNLGGAHQAAGDLSRAIPLHQQTLTDSERVLGPDHPDTVNSRNNLANAYESAGNLSRAIPLYEQTLTDRERVLGPDHPDTLTSRNNLANAYESAGNLSRAIPLYEQTLNESERVLGPDHPNTLTTRNNLANAYQAAGDLSRALPLHQQTLTDRERVLGPDHPDTLSSRNNLANAYESAGDLDHAIPLHQQTLTDRERVLGPDHPDTLGSRNNLASAYESAGNLSRALPLYEQTLTESERILGPDHPNTLSSRNNLASAYRAVGDLGRAIPLHQQTFTDRERVLGPDHPDTLGSRNNLAYAYQAAGNLARAIPLYERNLADGERILGPSHPHTLVFLQNLAAARDQAGE